MWLLGRVACLAFAAWNYWEGGADMHRVCELICNRRDMVQRTVNRRRWEVHGGFACWVSVIPILLNERR